MRDLLPDLQHDRLDPVVRAEVEAHVAACADCRAELALLRLVIAAVPAPRVDTARIVAALPSPASRNANVVRGRSGSPMLKAVLQAAAAIVILAGGAFLLTRRTEHRDAVITPVVIQTPPAPARPPQPMGSSTLAAVPAKVTAPGELPVGEPLHDLSKRELRALAGEIESLEAVTSSETEVVVPSIGRGGA